MSAEQSSGGSGSSSGNVITFRPRSEGDGNNGGGGNVEPLLTVRDVVRWTQGSRSKIYKAAQSGELKSIMLWGTRRRFRRADVLSWLERQGGGPRRAG